MGEFVNRNLSLCGLVAASLMLPACATITRGTSQKYNIETSPTEADVKLSTGQTCISPCKLNLKRKHGFIVTATKAGHEKAVVTVESKVRGGGAAGAAGNILLGGVIGVAVDATNGSMNDLTPNPLLIVLKPVAVAAVAAEVAPTTLVEPVTAPVSVEAANAAMPVEAVAPVADAEAPVEQPAPGL